MDQASKPPVSSSDNQFVKIVGLAIIALLGCAFNYWFLSWLTTIIYGWSNYLGMVWSIMLIVTAGGIIAALHDAVWSEKSHDWALLLGMLTTPFVVFAGAFAALAFGLDQFGVARYAGEPVTFRALYGHFLWQFVDMLPELDVWKVLHVDDPVTEQGLWSGLLLVAYRINVIYVLIATVKKALDL